MVNENTAIKTLSVRVKDKHAKILRRMASEVNQVWNVANAESEEFSWIPIPGYGWLDGGTSAYDLQKYLRKFRYDQEMIIGSSAFQETIAAHHTCRKKVKKNKLRWRKSYGTNRSLGWIPFKRKGTRWVNGQVWFAGKLFKVWDSYGLSKYDFRAGNFSEDARGRWYFNVMVKVKITESAKTSGVGIDLGLKTIVTCSNGEKLENKQFYRELEPKIVQHQKTGNKKQFQNAHAKIRNRRKDAINKFTTHIIKSNGFIAIGSISSSSLMKTHMAKSVFDVGWYMLKTQLKYKAIAHSVEFVEINEAYSTQTCSNCGSLPDSRPRGITGLGIREWECSDCGAQHDRDINAAKNILNFAVGCGSPIGGVSTF